MFKNSTRSQTIWLSRHTSYPIKHPHPLLSWPEASRCFTNCKNKTDITTRRVLWSNSFPLHSKSSPFLLLQQQQSVCSLCERWAWLWHTVCGTVGGQCCVIPPADLVEAHRYILPDSSLFFKYPDADRPWTLRLWFSPNSKLHSSKPLFAKRLVFVPAVVLKPQNSWRIAFLTWRYQMLLVLSRPVFSCMWLTEAYIWTRHLNHLQRQLPRRQKLRKTLRLNSH